MAAQVTTNVDRAVFDRAIFTACMVLLWLSVPVMLLLCWQCNGTALSGLASPRSCACACGAWCGMVWLVIALWLSFGVMMGHYWAGPFHYGLFSYCETDPPVVDPANAVFVWTGAATDSSITFRFSELLLPCAVEAGTEVTSSNCSADTSSVTNTTATYTRSWTLSGLSDCTTYAYTFYRTDDTTQKVPSICVNIYRLRITPYNTQQRLAALHNRPQGSSTEGHPNLPPHCVSIGSAELGCSVIALSK